ncbi:MAG: hypothetical protein GX206_07745 [Clostridiales bacterium]|nr:hypothetical protein [Clostridiales bacterium]
MNFAKKTVLGLLKFIGILVVSIIGAFIIVLGYSLLQVAIFARGDYLFFLSKSISIIPVIIIFFIFEYNYPKIKEKISNKKNEKEVKNQNASKAKKTVILTITAVFVGVLYIGITNYTILYKDTIKVASPIRPAGDTYNYSEINKIKVKVKKNLGGSYNLSYKVIFNNGDSAELFNGSMVEHKSGNHEDILLSLDEQLKEQGVEKEVNKKDFEKYAKELDKDFVSKIEKLFD